MMEVAKWVYFGKNRNMLGKIAQWTHKRYRVRNESKHSTMLSTDSALSLSLSKTITAVGIIKSYH